MINLDAYITGFISQNWLAVTIFLGLLKAISKSTPWVGDDNIHTYLAGMFGVIKKDKGS